MGPISAARAPVCVRTLTSTSNGVGVRYNDKAWSVDAAVAWRDQGGKVVSDTEDRNPRVRVTAGWRF